MEFRDPKRDYSFRFQREPAMEAEYPAPLVSPGKRTLTMGLWPRQSSERVESIPDPGHGHETPPRELGLRPSTEEWFGVAVRPDLASPDPAFEEPPAGSGMVDSRMDGDVTAITNRSLAAAMTESMEPAERHGQNNGQQIPTDSTTLQDAGGAPLPEATRLTMERLFSQDFSDVRVHHSSLASSLGARAAAIGSALHFAPGQYNPSTQAGRELLGHELTHVVQQRAGRVTSPHPQGKHGTMLNADPALEQEADRLGHLVARGQPVAVRSAASRLAPTGASGALQGSLISWVIKMGAKKVSKGTLKNFIKTQIKGKLKGIVNKNAAKRFAKEADDILAALDDPWWATAIGFIPVVGDAFDLARLPVKIKRAFQRADKLERSVKKLLRLQRSKASDLLPATLKTSKSYADELAGLTYGQILKMAPNNSKAAGMKKLIEQQIRLMEKL